MILAALILAAVVFSLMLAPRRKPDARRPPASPRDERDVERLRSLYLAGEIEIEEFEGQVAEALEHRSCRPETPVYTSHTEIHVYDAPPGHHLHVHL